MSIKLGHFELLELIGKGGVAAVFRAYDTAFKRQVAIKLLDEDIVLKKPELAKHFIHRARCASVLSHPNIVQTYFVGEEDGNCFIAMELLDGRTLDEIIKEEGPLKEETVIQVGIQAAEALRAGYASQVIHGDVKPSHIFITGNGTVKLLDFGLARLAGIEEAADSESGVWGSAYYIPPERAGGESAEDFRSDIYSLGATLFPALVGHPPFTADTLDELAEKRFAGNAPALRAINPGITENTGQIITRMLKKKTFQRYLDYDSLIQDLRNDGIGKAVALTQTGGNSDATPVAMRTTPADSSRSAKSGRLALIFCGGIAGILLALGVVFLVRNKGAFSEASRTANHAGPAQFPAGIAAKNNPLLVSDDDVGDPSVLKVDEGYQIYYSRMRAKIGSQELNQPASWSVANVFSRDFVHFENERDLTPRGFSGPGNVVKWRGRWIIPFNSYPVNPTRLFYSESSDLKVWSAPHPFLEQAAKLPWNEAKRVLGTTFIVEGDTLHCFFTGTRSVPSKANLIGHAITRDPKLEQWEILTENSPLLGVSERTSDGVGRVMVYRTGDHWTILYCEGLTKTHLAWAVSKDLRNLEWKDKVDLPMQHWMERRYGPPFVWNEGDIWRMLMAGINNRMRSNFGLFDSVDGVHWMPLPETSGTLTL